MWKPIYHNKFKKQIIYYQKVKKERYKLKMIHIKKKIKKAICLIKIKYILNSKAKIINRIK
jgi:hypothetical protein